MDKLSFSKTARIEALDNFKFSKNDCCNLHFLYGAVFSFENNIIVQDLEKPLKSIKKLLQRYDIQANLINTANSHFDLEILNLDKLNELINKAVLTPCQNCTTKFITGLFIAKAILTNPEKGYSLEFVFKNEAKAKIILDKLQNLDFNFKLTKRRNQFVVYTKQSEVIEDVLALVRAQNACLEIMSGKVYRDIVNKSNRLVNCDSANIDKITKASKKHTDAINKLIETDRFHSLSEELKEIANYKLENPELSLAELGEILSPPLTKSSLNRRLTKIYEIAYNEEK